MTVLGVLTGAAAAGAGLLSLHAALNARLLRTPNPRCVGFDCHMRLKPTHLGGRVSVLVPARDEAARIGACVRALLDSRGLDDLEVCVLDDGSTDGTAAAALRAGAGDTRLRVLDGRPLPPGWLGKPHACQQLAEAATGDVLVFVDADVTVEPDGIAATVALLRAAGLDAVSPYPRQVADGAGPRLVQPLLQWSWLTFLPLRLAERLPHESLAAANGQLLAVDARAYRQAGGHAAVRAHVLEDMAFARACKRAGLRLALADGTLLAACRMYGSWGEVRDGYAKSLWAAFGPPAQAAAVLAALGLLYVLPPLAALHGLVTGRRRQALLGAVGYAAGVAGRITSARRTGGRASDAWTHPASVAALGWLAARSWRLHRAGGLTWKGRALPGAGGT